MTKTMKLKLILLAAAALTGCMACQHNELPDKHAQGQDDYIGFATPTVTVEADTRSITYNALPENAQFGVLGYCVPYRVGTTDRDYLGGPSDWGTKHSLCPPSVFYKQAVNVANGACSYTPLKHWYGDGTGLNGEAIDNTGTRPEDYSYTFFAYYPYGDQYFTINSPTTETTAGAPRITFTMPQTGTALTVPLDHSITPDAMFGVLYNRQKAQGNVTFNFSHMLTALGFEVNNFSEFQLQIHSITLSGRFFKQITLDFSTSGDGTLASYSFPQEYYVGHYTLYDDNNGTNPLTLEPPSKEEDRTTSGLLPKNANGEGEHILLISGREPYFGPESEGDNAVTVNITYTFDGYKKANYTRPTTFTPTPGTKYTAQLNFVGETFILQFVVDNNEEWENGETDDNGDAVFE